MFIERRSTGIYWFAPNFDDKEFFDEFFLESAIVSYEWETVVDNIPVEEYAFMEWPLDTKLSILDLSAQTRTNTRSLVLKSLKLKEQSKYVFAVEGTVTIRGAALSSLSFLGLEVETISAKVATPKTFTLTLATDFLTDFSLKATDLFEIPELTALPYPYNTTNVDEVAGLDETERLTKRYSILWNCRVNGVGNCTSGLLVCSKASKDF